MKLEKQPFFSIVTVVYNDLAGLRLTAESVNAQSSRDFEWIVIDGASNDGTREFAEGLKRADKVDKWLSEKDTGIYDAMNKGIGMSAGGYTVFMNAGDVFSSPSVLADVKELLVCEGYSDMLFGLANFVLPNGGNRQRPPRRMESYIWHGLPANHQATYFKSALVKEVLYDTAFRICGDYYLVARLFMRGVKVSYADFPLADFRVGDTSYKSVRRLFLEPYFIQKNVLKLNIMVRLFSLLKRSVSTAGLVILSQPCLARFSGGVSPGRKTGA